ncbi:MAG: ABC transporter permease [Gemmatimonadota bacterium]
MTRATPDWLERAARAMHRALLRAYPRAFRDEFGRDMDETFADRWREARARGEWSMLLLSLRTILDTIAQAAVARSASLPSRSDMFHLQDVRYAFRLLRRSPVFTLLTLVVLAGGMGVSVFTFSFLYSAILRPLPLSDGARIVRVQEVQGRSTSGFDAFDFARMRSQVTTLKDVGTWSSHEVVLGGADGRAAQRVLQVTAVEWSVFDATHTPPTLGRPFREDDEALGAAPVIVLSHDLWTIVFGGDSTIVNQVIRLNGTSTQVIGVMPRGYGFPVSAESWVPLGAAVREATEAGRYSVNVFGRLVDGATPERAELELTALLRRTRSERPMAPADTAGPAPTVSVRTFPMAQMGDDGPAFFTIINVMATLILLLACINVGNLLLARANERARELAVRLALGASRGRLAMQSLWEPVFLVIVSGALATAIAAAALSFVNHWAHTRLEGNLAFWWTWGMDQPTLLAAGGFTTLTIAVLGGVMATRATSTRFNDVLRDGGARDGGQRAGRVSRALVATQVAAVTVLLFFGVLSGIAAFRLAHIETGYDTRNLLASSVEPDVARFPTEEARRAYWERLSALLVTQGGIEDAVIRARLGTADDARGAIEFGDGRVVPLAEQPRAWLHGVLGPLDSLGIRRVEGRALDDRDRGGQPAVAVISRAMAERYWPGRSPVGERIRLPGIGEATNDQWRTVVGVVTDVPFGDEFARNPRRAIAVYVPLGQHDAASATLLFRHRGDAAAATAALHLAVGTLDPGSAPAQVQSYDDILAKSALIAGGVSRLFGLSFAFALLLAISGTYGLMARSIGMRTREIGVRRALGATDRSIQRLLLAQGGRQLGIGAVVALPAMILVGVGFSRFFPIAPLIAIGVATAVAASIIAVVLAATWLPTRRALLVSPRDALWRDG